LYLNNDTKRIRGGKREREKQSRIKRIIFLIDLGPVVQDIWKNMNNTIHGKAYNKFRMYSAVGFCLFCFIFSLNLFCLA